MTKNMREYTDLIVDRTKPPIGYITLNRPERRNALSSKAGGTIDQLEWAFEEMREDPEIRVILIQGAGECFCTGFDLSGYDESYYKPPEGGLGKGREKEVWTKLAMTNPENPEAAIIDRNWWGRDSIWNNPKPVVAKVDSYCLGAGLWLCNHCDMVYATEEAVFGYPPIRFGGSAICEILPPWILGLRMTKEMGLTGRTIAAQEAYNCGLITRVFPRDKIDEEVDKICMSVAKVPPMSNSVSKWVINNYFDALPTKMAWALGMACCFAMENTTLPGHYFEFFENIRTKGLQEAMRLRDEKYGFSDEVLQNERKRLKAKREANKGK